MSTIPARFTDRMRLLGALKFTPKTLDAHYFVLQHESDDDLRYAVERAAKELDDFPSPRMLKSFIIERRAHDSMVTVIEPDRERKIPEPRSFALPGGGTVTPQREWSYHCDDCHDTGRISVWCGRTKPPTPWWPRRTCNRKYNHSPHEWTTLCKCIPRNPDVPSWTKVQASNKEE